jgi:hypothetical protein
VSEVAMMRRKGVATTKVRVKNEQTISKREDIDLGKESSF